MSASHYLQRISKVDLKPPELNAPASGRPYQIVVKGTGGIKVNARSLVCTASMGGEKIRTGVGGVARNGDQREALLIAPLSISPNRDKNRPCPRRTVIHCAGPGEGSHPTAAACQSPHPDGNLVLTGSGRSCLEWLAGPATPASYLAAFVLETSLLCIVLPPLAFKKISNAVPKAQKRTK
jgi:hypothetical protein